MNAAKHQNICPGCFKNKGASALCPLCGFDESAPTNPIVLPYWTLLNRQYLTGRVLGKLGGFGITYLAWDTRLDIPSAVKEYLPRDFAGRDATGSSIQSHSEEDGQMFRYGLKLFLAEAKTLAKFDHPNIVRVRNVFEGNGTAYLVMDYLEGESLNEYMQRKRDRMSERQALDILLPVLDGLEAVHNTGFLHRDIKPHNLYLSESGRTILLDFGAARQAIGENERSRSVVLTPGYAPFEQYHRRGNQGPWTDIYASAAVLYHMVTGIVPPESTERIDDDNLVDPREFNPKLSAGFAKALIQSMALQPKQRPQSVAEFRALLTGAAQASPKAQKPPPAPEARFAPPPEPQEYPERQGRWKLPAAIGLTVLAAGLAGAYLFLRPPTPAPIPDAAPPQALADPAFASIPIAPPPMPAKVETPPAPAVAEAAASRPAPATAAPAAKACPFCPEMVTIRGGEFWMGAADNDAAAQDDEKPRHKVRVEDFQLGKYEVTQGQWRQAMGDNPALFGVCGDTCPVENISWNEAQAFIGKINQATGQHCRLPTEEEWEYACRSGGLEQLYCGSATPDAVAWYDSNTQSARPVGGKKPNGLGLYDMSGSVWEWTSSPYRPYGGGAEEAPERVLRGGFWGQGKDRARATARNASLPELRNFDLGFRVACPSAKP